MADRGFGYEIVEKIGKIRDAASGWTKEFNIVSWNESDPKFDIREWSGDHLRMSRGITLTAEEMETIFKLYSEYKTKETNKA